MTADAITTPEAAARAALRAATHDVHERLHRLPAFARIADGTIVLGEYRSLLARLHGFHVALDDLFARHACALRRYGLDIGARTALLADDLGALGVSSTTIRGLPRARLSSDPRSTAALLGAFYVREGSTLGGRVLARRLDPLFVGQPIGDDRGRAFFAGDAAATARWRATLAAVEAIDADVHGARHALIGAATACFADFERWMT